MPVLSNAKGTFAKTKQEYEEDKILASLPAGQDHFYITDRSTGRTIPALRATAAHYLARRSHELSSVEEIVDYESDFKQRTETVNAELKSKAEPSTRSIDRMAEVMTQQAETTNRLIEALAMQAQAQVQHQKIQRKGNEING